MPRGSSYEIKPGQKFGQLTAVAPKGVMGVDGAEHVAWEFKCDCGKTVVCSVAPIWAGRKKTCGCGRDASLKTAIESITKTGASHTWLYARYYAWRRQAKRKNFNLEWKTFEEFYNWFVQGWPDINIFDPNEGRNYRFGRRQDNLGFTRGNVVLLMVDRRKNE